MVKISNTKSTFGCKFFSVNISPFTLGVELSKSTEIYVSYGQACEGQVFPKKEGLVNYKQELQGSLLSVCRQYNNT